MTLRLITPPELVSADEAFLARVKEHVSVDESVGDEQDDLIMAYIDAAVAQIDGGAGELGRTLLEQTWALDLPSFPTSPLSLPVPPVEQGAGWVVDSVTYFDGENVQRTLGSADYLAPDGRGYFTDAGAGFPETYDRPDAVTITVTSGSAEVSDLPANVLAAIQLMVGDLYAHRETATASSTVLEVPMSMTVKALLARHRYWRA